MNIATFSGLGLWIVSLRACDGGNIAAIVARCKRSGVTWIAPRSGQSDASGQVTKALVDGLQSEGIAVTPWWYSIPGTEDRQLAQVRALVAMGVSGVLLDAELEWETHEGKSADRRPEAADFAGKLREAAGPSMWMGHAPWWLPRAHPLFPFAEFGAVCDAVLPQCYWSMRPQGQTAAAMLDTSEADYDGLASSCPAAVPLRSPIGSSFHGTPANGVKDGQPCTPGDVALFLDRCETDPVLPFWSLYSYDAMPSAVWPLLEQRARAKVAATT